MESPVTPYKTGQCCLCVPGSLRYWHPNAKISGGLFNQLKIVPCDQLRVGETGTSCIQGHVGTGSFYENNTHME